MRFIKLLTLTFITVPFFYNCGSTAPIILAPIENIDKTPIKENELTENEKKYWGHLDLVKDTIPGMSVDKAYNEFIKGKKGETVIVAVIDSGIDIDHEDLDDVLWTNPNEIVGNGKDDDGNGYVDDIHGWNFLGKGYDEQFELTRILANGNTNQPRYAEAQAEFDKKYQEALSSKTYYDGLLQKANATDEAISKHLKKTNYTKEEVYAIKTTDETLLNHINTAKSFYSNGGNTLKEVKESIKRGIKHFSESLNFHFNKSFNGRKTGDNPDDMSQKFYGDNNVKPVKESESHGTHVAGIIAAERNNGKGMRGVANNVKIMAIRAVPNGDEYDKDVALAIRYAVDNGAKIINGSFGKSYSPHSDWVREAIKYAGDKDVVFVHAAGNDSKNADINLKYPDDNLGGVEVSKNYIRVGAIKPKYGSDIIAGFSNYGKKNVDVFAPGFDIYSAVPFKNKYKYYPGTSMAAPGVAGIAALVRSYYPQLSAEQVKKIILSSGIPIPSKVVVPGEKGDVKLFNELSTSGKIANAYNALIMAKQWAGK